MRGIDKSLTEEIGARKNSYSIAVSYRLFRQPVWPSVKRDFNGSDLYVQNINPIRNYAAELDVMDGRQPFMTIIWLIELQMNMKIHCILRLFAYNVTSNRMFAFGRCCQLLFKCIFVHHKYVVQQSEYGCLLSHHACEVRFLLVWPHLEVGGWYITW